MKMQLRAGLVTSELTFKQYSSEAKRLRLISIGISFASTCKMETEDVWKAPRHRRNEIRLASRTIDDSAII